MERKQALREKMRAEQTLASSEEEEHDDIKTDFAGRRIEREDDEEANVDQWFDDADLLDNGEFVNGDAGEHKFARNDFDHISHVYGFEEPLPVRLKIPVATHPWFFFTCMAIYVCGC